MLIKRIIDVTEKCFLVTIAIFTVGAMVQEVMLLIEQRVLCLKISTGFSALSEIS